MATGIGCHHHNTKISMPRCFLGSIKRQGPAYKSRNDPNVMITRSGLSIPRMLNGQSTVQPAYLTVPTKLTTAATNLYGDMMLLEQHPGPITPAQDQQQNDISRFYESYKSRSCMANSLSVVSRYEMLQDGIKIESKDINSTNHPSRFLVTREQVLASVDSVYDAINFKFDASYLPSFTTVGPQPIDPQPVEQRPVDLRPHETQPVESRHAESASIATKNKSNFTLMPSVEVPATPIAPDDDEELDLIPLPLVIDVPMLSPSLDESTDTTSTCSSSDGAMGLQRPTATTVMSLSKSSKSQHPLMTLLESVGEIKIFDLSPVELKERIQPFIMPPSYPGTHSSLFKCAICRKIYGGVQAFAEHVNSHLKLKNRCHVCGRVFTRHWLLKGHLRVHTGEKPFGCETCGKSFADRSNLRSHILIHTATKKSHECKKCGKSFTLKRYLQKHSMEVCKMDARNKV